MALEFKKKVLEEGEENQAPNKPVVSNTSAPGASQVTETESQTGTAQSLQNNVTTTPTTGATSTEVNQAPKTQESAPTARPDSVQATQQSGGLSPRLQQASQKANASQQKGTGFTNINRIMQANQGNKLGSTLSSGITGASANVKEGLQQAKNKFETEAQSNRLDTPEAAAKRDEVLGRFKPAEQNTTQANPVSSVQTEYDAARKPAQDALNNARTASYLDASSITGNDTQRNAAIGFSNEVVSKANTPATIQAAIAEIDRLQANTALTPNDRRSALIALGASDSGFAASMYTRGMNAMKDALSKKLEAISGAESALGSIDSDYSSRLQSAQSSADQTAKQNAFVAPTEQEISDFTKYRTGTYTGPDQLQDYTSMLSKAAQAETLGDLTRSAGGRQELLRRFVGGNDYTQGQKTLDEAILGQDKNSGLGAAARTTKGSISDVDKANRLADSKAEEYKGLAKIFGEETTKKIGETKSPLDEALNQKVVDAQAAETQRLENVKGIQNLLTGTDPQYSMLDKNTRLGLALTQAQMSGYLSEKDVQDLMGEGGVIQRALNIGLDPNKLLLERIQSNAAKNIGRTGVASDEEIARLNALDRLAGKQGTDLEFLQGQGDYEAGSTKFGLDSLRDYLTKSENEKAASDKAYADKLAAERARYMNQAIAGGQQFIAGNMNAIGSGIGMGLDAVTGAALYNPKQAAENAAGLIQGAGQSTIGGFQAANQGTNAIMEGLLKLNVGGNSIANTEGGKQLLKAIELQSKLTNEAAGIAGQGVNSLAGGISALGKGNVGDAFMKLSGVELAQNLTKQISGNLTREIENAAKAAANAISKATGYKGKWCFALDTIVELETGSALITDLKVGDEIFLGGKILEIHIKDSDPTIAVQYNGVHLTEDHKVLEDKKMIRVGDAKKTEHATQIVDKVVYIVTEKHVVIANDTVFSDCWQEG